MESIRGWLSRGRREGRAGPEPSIRDALLDLEETERVVGEIHKAPNVLTCFVHFLEKEKRGNCWVGKKKK